MAAAQMDIPGLGLIGKDGAVNQENSPNRKRNPQAYMFTPKKKAVAVGLMSPSKALLKPSFPPEQQGISSLSKPFITPPAPDEATPMSAGRSPITGETRTLKEPPKSSHIKEEMEMEVSVVTADSPPTSPLPTWPDANMSLFTPPPSPSSSSKLHPHIATKEDSDDENSSEESSDTESSDEELESEEDGDVIVLETVQTRPSPVPRFNRIRVPRRVSEVSVRRLGAVFPNGVKFHCMDSDTRRSTPTQFDSFLETIVTACPPSHLDHPFMKNPYFEFDSEPKDHLAATFNDWNVRHILGVVPPTAADEASGSVPSVQNAELGAKPNFLHDDPETSLDSRDGASGSSYDFDATADFTNRETIPTLSTPLFHGSRTPTPGAVAQSSAKTEGVFFDNDIEDLDYPEEAAHLDSVPPDAVESASPSTLPSCVLPGTAPAVSSSDILSMEHFQLPSWPKSPEANAFTAALTESLSPNVHTKSKKRRKREREERCERDGRGVVSDSTQEDEEDGKKGSHRSKRAKSPEDDLRELEAPRKRKNVRSDSDIDAERQRSIKRKGKQRARDISEAAEAEDPALSRKRRRAPSVDALSESESKPRSKRKPSAQHNTRLSEPVSPQFGGNSLADALNFAAQSNQSFRRQTGKPNMKPPQQAAHPEREHTYGSFQDDLAAAYNTYAETLNNPEPISALTTAARSPPSKKAKANASTLSPRPTSASTSGAQHQSSSFATDLAAAYNGIAEDLPTPRPAPAAPRPIPSSHSSTSKSLAQPLNTSPRRIVARNSRRDSFYPANSPPSTSSTLPAQRRMAKKPQYSCESEDDDDDDEAPRPVFKDNSVSLGQDVDIDVASKPAGPSTAASSRPPRHQTTLKKRTSSARPKAVWPHSSEEHLYCHPCRKNTPYIVAKCLTCNKAYCIKCLRTRFKSLPAHVAVPTTTNVSNSSCPYCEDFCTCPFCQRRRVAKESASTLVKPEGRGRTRTQAKNASARSSRPQSQLDGAPETSPSSVTEVPARKLAARPISVQRTQGDAIPGPSSLPQSSVDDASETLLSITGRPARRAAARPVYTEPALWDEDEDVKPHITSASVKRAGNSSKRLAPRKSFVGESRVYCHQCRGAKGPHISFIRCTNSGCGKVFCQKCLRHRYRTIPSHIPMPTSSEFPSDTCPLCEGWCNCDVCTAKRGKVYVHRKFNTEDVEDEDEVMDLEMLLDDESDAQEQSDEDERYPIVNLDHIPRPRAELEALGVSGLSMGPLYHPVTAHRMGTGMLVTSQEEDEVKREDVDAGIGTKDDDGWDIDNWEKQRPRVFCVRDEDSQLHCSVPDGFVLYTP
ncbi:hypothetical protein CYLTODRAFT_491364 [Cylindrobasidium torrendii FP15055 ss-10]|uniref:RING-type domain-containing protein n=1 Tax=Cylindrobasidium torrendii FP15055 ss-10 TaxID=1314674 RepID=A0A0D7BAN3_9AGAR|nr:hypothetical protein CYLTODRAFT_491364 [Cylindrobasidium torrendii FP15055 ss-10]